MLKSKQARLTDLRKFIFWEYPRGSKPYDLMVAVILAFIFLTPREWFRDQPRAPNVVMLPSENGVSHFWIEPDLLAGLGDEARFARASQLVKNRVGKHQKFSRLEPIFNSEEEILGYMAYVTE
jgi:hypothetical protein